MRTLLYNNVGGALMRFLDKKHCPLDSLNSLIQENMSNDYLKFIKTVLPLSSLHIGDSERFRRRRFKKNEEALKLLGSSISSYRRKVGPRLTLPPPSVKIRFF